MYTTKPLRNTHLHHKTETSNCQMGTVPHHNLIFRQGGHYVGRASKGRTTLWLLDHKILKSWLFTYVVFLEIFSADKNTRMPSWHEYESVKNKHCNTQGTRDYASTAYYLTRHFFDAKRSITRTALLKQARLAMENGGAIF